MDRCQWTAGGGHSERPGVFSRSPTGIEISGETIRLKGEIFPEILEIYLSLR